MREDVFYWKCDNPLSTVQQRRLYLGSKYSAEMEDTARAVVTEFFHASPDSLNVFGVEGNHFVYRAEKGDRRVLLRTDDGLTDDDYLAVESAVMKLAGEGGVPVPEVYWTDVSRSCFPVRFQLMEFVGYPSLAALEKEGKLNCGAAARECGRILRMLHSIRTPGYGFFVSVDELRGMDDSPAAYFRKRFDDHLAYLEVHGLFCSEDAARVRTLTGRALPLLEGVPGVLLHRDFAFWNLLGTAEKIHAVIDWDDAVSGDPADDFGVLNCFHEKEFMENVIEAYGGVDEAFRIRIELHTLRNMLWKAVIRDRLGYFEQGEGFFLARNTQGIPLKEYTFTKLFSAMERLEEMI